MTAEEFLIGELAQKTNVSVRTIRYYISEGLLPAPDSRGRYTVYDHDYVERIKLIKRLKDAFLPIKEIRTMLETQTRSEIEEFLRVYEAQRTQSNDALGYINDLLGKSPAPSPLASAARSPMIIPELRKPSRIDKKALLIDESTWKRIVLAPGIEIHVEQKKAALYDDLIGELFNTFQARFIQRAKK